jgi:twitching motility two-component system response regulator PilG
MRLFSWQQIESVLLDQTLCTLQPLMGHGGSFSVTPNPNPPLINGFELNEVLTGIQHRHQQWESLAAKIPGPDAVPFLHPHLLQGLACHPRTGVARTPADDRALVALQRWVDGKRSLLEIAELQNRDPLSVARSLLSWVEKDWVLFNHTSTAQKLPTVLVVDDSDLMQKMISHTLGNHYRVLLANNAIDALSLIYHEVIALLLLDVTMPVMDGLELCRTVRNMPKFSQLPIVMLTARDGFFDKVKGRMAGATEYLTKPFNADELQQVVSKYVPQVTRI